MTGGVVNIGYPQLLLAVALIAVDLLASWKLRLGLVKSITISTVRLLIQLLALGFVLGYLFQYQTFWWVALAVAVMSLAATQIACDRTRKTVHGIAPSVFLSIFVPSVSVALGVVDGVIGATPWWNAQQLIPIMGMVMGNALSSVSVAIERLFADMDSRSQEMYTLVALGATPREAAFPSIKAAVSAGMAPTLATMCAAGIVQIPGMMSGQILAGADPMVAAKYQIVVLLMISAASTAAIVAACYLAYKRRFSSEGYYLEPGLRDDLSQKGPRP